MYFTTVNSLFQTRCDIHSFTIDIYYCYYTITNVIYNCKLFTFQTRCDSGNLCNNDPGDFSGTTTGGTGAKNVVVPGRKNPE